MSNILILWFMKKDVVSSLYDLLVYLTTNYSDMPISFKNRFSETFCTTIRQILFNSLCDIENGK